MDTIQKPFNVLCIEETTTLKNNLLNVIQESQLPLAIRKMVIEQEVTNILIQIDNAIKKEEQDYYKKIAETNEVNAENQV